MSVADYRVRLDAFEGPMDLLLFLIRKSEVDIHDIPIGQITDQYMAMVKAEGNLEHLDIEIAGEFLVMAATLMEIKSRLLTPLEKDAKAGQGGESSDAGRNDLDPRTDLVQKLLAYKRYRDAAFVLEQRHAAWEARFPAAPALVPDAPVAEETDAPVELEDLQLIDLVEAFSRIMATVDFSRVGEHRVFDDETPIQLHADDLLEQLRRAPGAEELSRGRGMELRQVFTGRTKAEAVGLFLAMLELIRQRKINVRQEKIHDRIWVELAEETASDAAPTT